MVINGNIYNHLSNNLVPRKRNITHKSSDLKAVYSNMAKYNKNSPLYLLSLSENKQEHMINIKEAAITLKDVSDSFADTDSAIYAKKIVHSQDESIISGSFKTQNYEGLPEELNIKIDTLAKEQVNVGEYLSSNSKDVPFGSHTFTLETINSSSHFNISVSNDDTNLDIQKKIMQYINNRDLGINASILNEGNNSALMLSSVDTGVPATDDGLHFSIRSQDGADNIIHILGLNNISVTPSNSTFYINGESHSSTSNHISINQIIELDFHAATDKEVTINFVPDTEAAISHIDAFVDAYNSLVDLSSKSGPVNAGSRNLFNDISSIVHGHKGELQQAGLSIDENNRMVKDDTLISSSVKSGKFAQLFSQVSSFKDDIAKATDRLTLDPMAYINKLLVTYPNSKDKNGTAYTKSLYSGLMYNNYA